MEITLVAVTVGVGGPRIELAFEFIFRTTNERSIDGLHSYSGPGGCGGRDLHCPIVGVLANAVSD